MKIIVIDGSNVENPDCLHEILARELAFPDWYGANLDALYDCLTDIAQDVELVITHWHHVAYTLKDYAEKLLYVFSCAATDNKHLTVTLHP